VPMPGHPLFPSSSVAVACPGVILVVEDAPDLRACVAVYFTLAGFEVLEANDSQEALAAFDSGRHIDLVFSDINMPGTMDGVGLAQWLALNRPLLPILLTSAEPHPELNQPSGRRRFVQKPYLLGALERHVRELVGTQAVH
jgi:CheY-like chemotaxis protein